MTCVSELVCNISFYYTFILVLELFALKIGRREGKVPITSLGDESLPPDASQNTPSIYPNVEFNKFDASHFPTYY